MDALAGVHAARSCQPGTPYNHGGGCQGERAGRGRGPSVFVDGVERLAQGICDPRGPLRRLSLGDPDGGGGGGGGDGPACARAMNVHAGNGSDIAAQEGGAAHSRPKPAPPRIRLPPSRVNQSAGGRWNRFTCARRTGGCQGLSA